MLISAELSPLPHQRRAQRRVVYWVTQHRVMPGNQPASGWLPSLQ
jgi:hypothetical protein